MSLEQRLASHRSRVETYLASRLPPADMPGVAWQAHSFFNSTTGAIFPLAILAALRGGRARVHEKEELTDWFEFY